MKKILAVVVALALPACTDQYGNPDPAGSALLGAAAGAAVGLGASAIASSNQDRYQAYDGRYYYDRPRRSRAYYGEPYSYRPRYYRRDPYPRW